MKGDILEFAVRLDVAIDVAHAVTYLHMYTGMSFKEAYDLPNRMYYTDDLEKER